MPSLLGSIAKTAGEGFMQYGAIQEQRARDERQQAFAYDLEARRAERQERLATMRIEAGREDAATQREFMASQGELDREFKRGAQRSETIETAFNQISAEYDRAQKTILSQLPKDAITGQPMITEAAKAELQNLQTAYQQRKTELIDLYGSELKGTTFEVYLHQNTPEPSMPVSQTPTLPKPQEQPVASETTSYANQLAVELNWNDPNYDWRLAKQQREADAKKQSQGLLSFFQNPSTPESNYRQR